MHQHSTGGGILVVACSALLTAGGAGTLDAQTLPLGSTTEGTTSTGAVSVFEFRASSAGVLTVAVRGTGQTDLVLQVTDGDGQPLPDGDSDQDLGGNSGAEQLALTIPREGVYFVRVRPFSSGMGQFRIGASWLEFPELEQPRDPDGSPSSANSFRVGEPTEATIDPASGDHWDWYSVRIEQAGLLTVATLSSEGDLVLEAFNEGSFGEAAERSDQDLQEVSGNEAITLSVTQGQTLYFKVSAFASSGGAIAYRLTAGLIPD